MWNIADLKLLFVSWESLNCRRHVSMQQVKKYVSVDVNQSTINQSSFSLNVIILNSWSTILDCGETLCHLSWFDQWPDFHKMLSICPTIHIYLQTYQIDISLIERSWTANKQTHTLTTWAILQNILLVFFTRSQLLIT